jgi:CDP-glucose 4,6-dehydratase
MHKPNFEMLQGLSGPILVTGHTGFKGSWMTMILKHLGVATVGFSLPPIDGSLYLRAGIKSQNSEEFGNICDYDSLERYIDRFKPSAIIHMAAQPLVLESYIAPRSTFETNVIGTTNILDIASKRSFVKAIVVVTTDKVYKNTETQVKFKETDPLSGKDPYSASKVAAEAAVLAWRHISDLNGGPNIAAARAGNVIGGGDFTKGRLLPDIIRNRYFGELVQFRNLESVRPWQHVLDPLQGYLMLLSRLLQGDKIEAVNFSCINEVVMTVRQVVEYVNRENPDHKIVIGDSPNSLSCEKSLEARWLNLDSTFAKEFLGWQNIKTQEAAIHDTLLWWYRVAKLQMPALDACLVEVENFY